MISADEYLERVVAGVQAATTKDAEVLWNDKINGRQFDVSVRFTSGTLSYLVLIEVKNRTRKASAQDVEAFVTKTRDHGANKSVFVTAAGFQSGAIEVAERHSVDLFTVDINGEDLTIPSLAGSISIRNPDYSGPDVQPQLTIGEPSLAANIEQVTLVYADGKRRTVPSEQSQMVYYLKKTQLRDGRSLLDLVQGADYAPPQLGETIRPRLAISPPQRLTPPDDYFFPAGILSAVELRIIGRMGRPIEGNVRIDPGLLAPPVVYTNVRTGEQHRFTLDQLLIGRSEIVPGRFYFITNPLNYYCCAGIEGDLIHWHLIESFQNGDLVSGTFSQRVDWGASFIPVKDKIILKRLEMRLEDYYRRSPDMRPRSPFRPVRHTRS